MANLDIVPPRVPFVDVKTGRVSREWWLFLSELFRRVGGAGSAMSIQDLAVASHPPFPEPDPLQPSLSQIREELSTIWQAIADLQLSPRQELGTLAHQNVPLANQVAYATATGVLGGSTKMTFDGTTHAITGNQTVSGTQAVAGALAIGNTVNTVSATNPNRTISMDVAGTTYYLHAKTTND